MQTTLLGISELTFDCDWQMARHSHTQYHEMIFLLSGRLAVQTQGQHVVGSDGQALIYPQTIAHVEQSTGRCPIRMFCLAWEGPPRPDWPLVSPDRQGRMAMLLPWMQELFPARTTQDQQTLDALLCALLAEYANGASTPGDERLVHARRLVQEHLSEPVRLETLAAASCLSKYHFAAMFQAEYGLSPMAWVRQTRVQAARALLLTSTLPLSAIAARVGFRDEFHLSRVFRRVTGQPPSALRVKRSSTAPCGGTETEY